MLGDLFLTFLCFVFRLFLSIATLKDVILEVGSCFVRFPGRVFPLGFEDVLPGHPVNLLKLLMSMLQCMSARFGRPRRLSPMQAPASANGPDPQWLRHRFRSPGMHVPDAGVAGLSLAEGMRQCGCVCVFVCVCVKDWAFSCSPLIQQAEADLSP